MRPEAAERRGVRVSPWRVRATSKPMGWLPLRRMDSTGVEDGLPGSVGGAELLVLPGAAQGFDVDVLDVGAEVGKAPGDVRVVADDDEGEAGDGDAGDVEGLA